MKNLAFWLLVIIGLTSCHQSPQGLMLQGEIKGLTNDTLLLYSGDGTYDRVDTIIASDGRFSQRIEVDTLTYGLLLLDQKVEYPLFFNKGDEITVTGTGDLATGLSATGNALNDEYTAFCQGLEAAHRNDSIGQQKAEAFIKAHPASLVSLYLIDRYFVQQPYDHPEQLRTLLKQLSGYLQDTPYWSQIDAKLTDQSSALVDRYAYYFSLPDQKGERLSRSSDAFKQKLLLINFWSSWSDSLDNAKANQELKALHRQYKNQKGIALLGISADTDKAQWTQAIKRDSLTWKQVCDFGGLNSEVIRRFAVDRLPMTVILSPEGKILARNLWGEALKKQIKQLLDDSKTKKK